jgi:hypothetical protein
MTLPPDHPRLPPVRLSDRWVRQDRPGIFAGRPTANCTRSSGAVALLQSANAATRAWAFGPPSAENVNLRQVPVGSANELGSGRRGTGKSGGPP